MRSVVSSVGRNMSHYRELRAMIFLAFVVIDFEVARGQLIRPLRVYESLIRGTHDYFNNTCIILLHGTPNPVEARGLEEGNGFLALQKYLSTTAKIRTAIMDFQMFRNRVGQSYYRINRPLFVLLNDSEKVRKEFSHVSTWIAMSYPTWLVFLKDETHLEDFLSEAYVPFDCTLLVARRDASGSGEIIREAYRIDEKDRLRTMKFGTWDASRGVRGPRHGLYRRRNDLHGHEIRVASIDDPPVSRILRNERNDVIGIGGFFGEVIQLLQEGMNCTFKYEKAESWGVRLENGTWTGSIGMLVDGTIDLAATELMMTSDRLDVVQFTEPVYSTKCRTYIKRPDSTAVKWDAYLAPFATHIWTSICLLITIAGGTISAIERSVGRVAAIPYLAQAERPPTRLSEILFYVFGAFCGQGMEVSSLDKVRLVHLVVHLTAVVVLAAYSAALISFLAVKSFIMPFTTMEGLLDDGTYRFAVIADSADYSFFQNTSDKVLSVMFDELLAREKDLPLNYLDGLKRVCKEEKYAFMTMDNMAAVLQERLDCSLEPLDVIMQTTIAMAVPRDSPYRGIIDSNILMLRDSGLLQRLLKTEWSMAISRPKSSWTSVELEDVTPLLLFLTSSLFVTFFIFFLERVIYHRLASRPIRRAGTVATRQ